MKVADFVPVNVSLSATPPGLASFGVSCVLTDHTDIPVDRRYRSFGQSGYLIGLTSGSDAYDWCQTLFGQNNKPSQVYVGRWVSVDSASYRVMKNAAAHLAAIILVDDGCVTVTGATGSDILTALDFTSCATITEVAAVINAALTAGGLSDVTCTVDKLGRLIFTDTAGTGAGQTTPTLVASGTGTHIELADYLDYPNSFLVDGVDAETLVDAVAAILELDNTPFVFAERGATKAQQVEFSVGINALSKLCVLRITDPDAKDSAETDDAAYQISQLSHQKTYMIYTEHTAQHPDAAICGEIFPRKEATCNFALTPLTNCSVSGLDIDDTTAKALTSDERSALIDKGCDFLVKPSTLTHTVKGLAAGGNEMRIMFGKLFLEAKISEGVYGYMVSNDVVTFSDPDIQAIKGIVEYWLDELVARKVIDAGYTIEMPSAASFTAAQKATHQMDLLEIAEADGQIAATTINISLTWNV